MFSHVMVGTNDIEASKKFYDSVLGSLGYEPAVIDKKGRCFYKGDHGRFGVGIPLD